MNTYENQNEKFEMERALQCGDYQAFDLIVARRNARNSGKDPLQAELALLRRQRLADAAREPQMRAPASGGRVNHPWLFSALLGLAFAAGIAAAGVAAASPIQTVITSIQW